MNKLAIIQRALDYDPTWPATLNTAFEVIGQVPSRENIVKATLAFADRLDIDEEGNLDSSQITDEEILAEVKNLFGEEPAPEPELEPEEIDLPESLRVIRAFENDTDLIDRIRSLCLKEDYLYSDTLAIRTIWARVNDIQFEQDGTVSSLNIPDNRLASALTNQWKQMDPDTGDNE